MKWLLSATISPYNYLINQSNYWCDKGSGIGLIWCDKGNGMVR
ncbi:hypothetical protein CZ794_03750 [Psychrobacter sp. JB385]|nr:hypothetical protein CZ794_03750 [Psychrobacter sp. JB385]